MAKIKVTPVASSGIPSFIEEGKLTKKEFPQDGTIYYINGRSFPAEIVEILEGTVSA